MSTELARKYKLTVHPNTIDGWRLCKAVPRDTAKLHAFLGALTELAQTRNREPVPRLTREQWDRLADAARRARTDRSEKPAPRPHVRPALHQEWSDAVTGSKAWQLVEPAGQEQAGALREQALDVVRRLVELYDERRGVLDPDPWNDPELAHRTRRRTGLLLHELHGRLGRATLTSAEATLIALLPFLFQAHGAYIVADLAHIDPTDLDDQATGGPDREKYNVLLRSHKRLVRQALRGDELPDRDDGRPEIGWWLFHQWTKQESGSIGRLLADLRPAGAGLGTLLDRQLLTRLLACAHVPPRKLYGRGCAGLLKPEPFSVELGDGDWQPVREHLVGPLFAIAHAMALEATDLPPAVVEHMGIPDPVAVGPLRNTLNGARWVPAGDTLGLQATCDHPAVVAALVAHTQHVDALLRDARRVRPTEEIGALPVYAHADEVQEADDTGGSRQAGEVIRFRLDEERIQELLMGENLYRDRSLAIRELYQNALDACRYRRAWEHARDGRDSFEGRIEFEQDYDEKEKRYYLECRDNGIGMDETVLAEVFSRAGVRFTDHARFQEESRRWRKNGVAVRPNSRFGIGVLSYFMLADEIRVTTRPASGGTEQLTVLITGPGHYFRVSRTDADEPIGTTVRLYLREGDRSPSCVRELRRLLGIAEFLTHARHGNQEAVWEPGRLREREAPVGGPAGFVAHGHTVSRPEAGQGVDGQVVWSEHGGGILADGIFIEPRVRRGMLADPQQTRRLRGAVVNLTGATRPKDLSVDRTEILDADVDEHVERLIRDALPTLLAADPPLLTTEWLADVSGLSPRLADLVTEAAGEAGFVLKLNGQAAPMDTAGFFPPDADIVHWAGRDFTYAAGTSAVRPDGTPDDVTLLWRLLAHRPNAELAALTELVPELSRVREVLVARPSDVLLRTDQSMGWGSRGWRESYDFSDVLECPGHALSVAEACGMPYRDAVSRMELLGLGRSGPPVDDVCVDSFGAALVDTRFVGMYDDDSGREWCSTGTPVPPGHLLKAHLVLNIGVDEALARMRACGFSVPEGSMPTETPEDWVVVLLSSDLDSTAPWLDLSEPVTAGHVLAAMAKTGRSFVELVDTLRAYGFRPELGSLDEQTAGELLRQGAAWGWGSTDLRRLEVTGPVPVDLLARAAVASAAALHDIARQVSERGLTVPDLPEQVLPADAGILSADALGLRWLARADDEIPLDFLLEAAKDLGLPPALVAARVRAYGLVTPDTELPERAEPDDAMLLGRVRYYLEEGDEPRKDPKDLVHAVIHAAHHAWKSPGFVVDRLARYGLGTPLTAPPAKASRHDIDLVTLDHLEERESALDWDEPVPVYHLVSVGPRLVMEQEEVVERLTAFGFRMPALGVDDLDETDRSLCLDDHGDGGYADRLPLTLRHPIYDFLHIARLAPLPLPELLPRLTRLGVDLPRVVEAVRAALPKIPGLVMTPTEP
ncbi:hypothetical protein [Streptomyces sp. GbtcB6]|uniref:wHTH domain-containing protein n=1 Tax=Streptomyces sp. GbtcB6 TaxID=2824751 RepID=UPI001C308815|nr:hypothetical protein [Streptomyces sp. GbtcB6]